jgi:hypothetical protein
MNFLSFLFIKKDIQKWLNGKLTCIGSLAKVSRFPYRLVLRLLFTRVSDYAENPLG